MNKTGKSNQIIFIVIYIISFVFVHIFTMKSTRFKKLYTQIQFIVLNEKTIQIKSR